MKNFFYYDPKLLLYGFLIIFFASYGQTFFIALFNNDIKKYYNLSDGEFGLVYAVATIMSSLLLVNFAKLIDYLDLRVYSIFVTIGLIIPCLAIYFLPSSVMYLFLIIFALRFFGQGAMSHAGTTSMARYFGEDRGKAISIATLGGTLGIMLLPIVVVYLKNYFSFRQIWLLSSLSLIIFLPILFFILGNQKIRQDKFSNNIGEQKEILTILSIIKNKNFLIYLPLTIAFSFIGTGLMFHQIYIFNEKNWTIEMLSTGYLFFGLFSFFGLVFGGPLIDILNPRKAIILILTPIFIAIIILITFDNFYFLVIYMSLFGLNLGISAPFTGSLWAVLFNLESLGTVKALFHALAVLASALSPLLFGYIIDWGFGIGMIALISLTMIIIATILPLILSPNE
tara:strand:- start:4319 stop:5509 length:1191 start_codon:yes stop_codon:yes gene_type:complete